MWVQKWACLSGDYRKAHMRMWTCADVIPQHPEPAAEGLTASSCSLVSDLSWEFTVTAVKRLLLPIGLLAQNQRGRVCVTFNPSCQSSVHLQMVWAALGGFYIKLSGVFLLWKSFLTFFSPPILSAIRNCWCVWGLLKLNLSATT